MKELGYVNYYQVLNAKDYGIPQNRERDFTVSIREDIWDRTYDSFGKLFEFPKPSPLRKKLKDVLEKEVDEKYYLSDDKAKTLKFSDVSKTIRSSRRGSLDKHSWDIVKVGDLDIKGQDQIKRVYDSDGVSPTLSTMQGCNRQPKIVEDFYKSREPREYTEYAPTLRAGSQGLKVKTANKKGYDLAQDGDDIDLAYPNSITRRGRVGHEVSKTLECGATMGTLQNYRIRKLTPKECWRLMGFDDSDFEKAEKVNSNSQLYKQAGNSIVVNVLEGILRNLLCKTTK
jgi:DNA (cytosine-5)-methyltransferase 1